jgi:cell division septal protein FtsQ
VSHARPVSSPTFEQPSVAPFRRGGAVPRRRRPGRQARAVVGRLAAPLAGLLLVGATTLWVLSSPSFAFTAIKTSGTARVTDAWLRRELGPLLNENLLLLPLAQVRTAVERHPWVERVGTAKELPHEIHLTIVERQPSAVVVVGGTAYWAEADGSLIAPLGPTEATGELPILTDESPWLETALPTAREVPRALELLRELERCCAAWKRELIALSMLGDGEFRLETAALPFPILVRADDLETKAASLKRLLPQIDRRYERLDRIDLRFPQRLILAPTSAERLAELAAAEDAARAAEEQARLAAEAAASTTPNDTQEPATDSNERGA